MDDKAKGDVCKPKAHVAGGLLGSCKVYLQGEADDYLRALESAVVNKALADVHRQLGRERGLR